MAELRAIVPLEKREEVVRSLHEEGNVQLESVDEELVSELELERESAPAALGEITSLTMEMNRVLDVFEKPPTPSPSRTEKVKDYWDNFFKPKEVEKREVEIGSRKEALKVRGKIIKKIGSEVKDLGEELETSKNKIAELREKIRSTGLLENFDFDSLKVLKSSEFTYADAGAIPAENLPELKNDLKKKIGEEFVLRSRKVDEDERIVCIWTLSEDKEEAIETLNFYGFDSLTLPRLRGKPKKVRRKLEKKLQSGEEKREECFQKIEELSRKHKKDLLAVREVLNIEKERAGAVNNFSKTETATVIQGWVPKDEADEVEKVISKASDGMGHVKISNPGNPDADPPTLLRNPPILKNFEFLTELFGLPGEGEIDPTPLLAFTYVIFFGIMLTDVAYGAILLLVSVGLFRGMGKTNKSIRDFSMILILGSSATIVTGIITGSYFGDFMGYIGIGEMSLYNPIENPMPLLLFSIFFGIIHEYLGISVGIWEKIQQGKRREALGDGVSWLLLIPGASILICQAFGWASFSLPIVVVGGASTGISLIMLLFVQGPMGIMNMFSMLGNILSYTRIMALALVTSSLALTFNAVASLGWGFPVIGIVLGALIFVGGQVFSLLINFISSFVHSLRLHFVEFFDKFYRGGGTKFKPFKIERAHTGR